jgi:hypothetical protein
MLELETIFGGSVVVARAVQQTTQPAANAALFTPRIRLKFSIPSIFSAPGDIWHAQKPAQGSAFQRAPKKRFVINDAGRGSRFPILAAEKNGKDGARKSTEKAKMV